jgi:hypothetical protein
MAAGFPLMLLLRHLCLCGVPGAWNLAKAPFLRWSEGDLWNVTMELAAGGVYEYK